VIAKVKEKGGIKPDNGLRFRNGEKQRREVAADIKSEREPERNSEGEEPEEHGRRVGGEQGTWDRDRSAK
jgi:hypothetical protein